MSCKVTLKCPMCGSDKLGISEREEKRSVPFGPDALCVLQVVTCSECGEHGDFGLVNDARIEAAIDASVTASVDVMLSHLEEIGLSNAYIERVFDIPARTIARWKRGERSATVVAFLRLLSTFPWLVEVAEENFSQREADLQVIDAFFEVTDRARSFG